jgi:glycosyltransferase involved in cell wall biosynthesis
MMDSSQQPLVTIGLPVYNAGRFLMGALQSVFAQSCEDWELIVVDDGSTDDAWEVVEHISDPRVRAIRDGVHRGLAARLNQIVSLARGQFIARMDADDMCHPERIERQIRFLKKHPEIDAISSSLAVLDRKGRFSGWRLAQPDHAAICAHPLKGFRFVHAATLARAEWARRNRYNEHNSRCEDWELLSRTSQNSRFANLTDCLYFYREYDSFSLLKYVHRKITQSTAEIREVARYGFVNVAVSTIRHFSHIGIYAIATAFAAQGTLIRRRSASIPQETRDEIEAAAAHVASTELTPSNEVRRPAAEVLYASPAPLKCE